MITQLQTHYFTLQILKPVFKSANLAIFSRIPTVFRVRTIARCVRINQGLPLVQSAPPITISWRTLAMRNVPVAIFKLGRPAQNAVRSVLIVEARRPSAPNAKVRNTCFRTAVWANVLKASFSWMGSVSGVLRLVWPVWTSLTSVPNATLSLDTST